MQKVSIRRLGDTLKLVCSAVLLPLFLVVLVVQGFLIFVVESLGLIPSASDESRPE